jgi:hypothetical protein
LTDFRMPMRRIPIPVRANGNCRPPWASRGHFGAVERFKGEGPTETSFSVALKGPKIPC